ncbi:MAG TPA: SEC-C domain-containing protein [Chloroflexi bacterium]|jgi:hypothetical protein|nr:SEC-C domain-containing protein [Chloroflexota bacterium]
MLRARRNDPCPCGSGKKYKNCCMRQDQMSASRELDMTQIEGALLNELYRYAQTPRFGRDMTEAFNFYWGGRYELEGLFEVDVVDARRTVEWFMHDYRTSTDRRTVLDLFIERETANMPEEAMAVLRAWNASVIGLFRVAARPVDGRTTLVDLLREEMHEVYDASLARNAWEGDLVVGRLFEMAHGKRMSLMTMLLPAEMEEDLVDYVTNAYHLFREEHPGANWERFLRENGHIMNAYLLSNRAEAFHRLIGPGTRFHNPALTRDKLREMTAERVRERQLEESAGEVPAERRSAGGIILPGVESGESEEGQSPASPGILVPGRDF